MPFIILNPHPALSGFPPVLLTLLIVSELWSMYSKRQMHSVQSFLLIVLAGTLPLTYFSGWWAADGASASFEVPDDAVAMHQLAAKAFSLSLFLPLLAFYLERSALDDARRRHLQRLFRAGLLLSFCAAAATGYLGGRLVFEHGAGITGTLRPAADRESPK